jgi:hypothetical protein
MLFGPRHTRIEQRLDPELPPLQTNKAIAMNGIMNGSGSMMWGMGWGGLLGVVVLVLGIAALAKYLLSNDKR